MDDHLATIWESIADRLPDEIAMVYGSRQIRWRDFEQRAARFAAALASAGVGPGQTVAIDMYNCPEYLEVFFAALKIRAVPANVNYRYLDEELTVLLRQSEAVVLVYHADLRERVSRAAAAVPGLRLLAEADPAGPGSTLPGAQSYEALIGSHLPAPRIFRPGTDTFLSYTGAPRGCRRGWSTSSGTASGTPGCSAGRCSAWRTSTGRGGRWTARSNCTGRGAARSRCPPRR